MTDDQERVLVAAFLMCGETITYDDTVAARFSMSDPPAIQELVKWGILRETTRGNMLDECRYRLTDAAIKKFKGE